MTIRRTLTAGALSALAALGSGCGGEQSGGGGGSGQATAATPDGRLSWVAPPKVYPIPDLPGDSVLRGAIRNDTGQPVDMRVDRVEVLDAEGRKLRTSVRFAEAFGHALYGPGGPPAPLRASRYDQARLGERVTVAPGKDQPITLAWRAAKGKKAAAESIEISGYPLTLP